MEKRITAIIVAAGNGSRMESQTKKQYMFIKDKPILGYTVEKFYQLNQIDQIFVVCDKDNLDFVNKQIIEKYGYMDRVHPVIGGITRTQSVYNGIKAAEGLTDYILIHDGVRPMIARSVILEVIEKAIEFNAAIVCTKAQDTIKLVKGNKIEKTLDRSMLWHAETPQAFDYKLLKECMEKAVMTEIPFTDEASILEYFGYDVYVVDNNANNLKITTIKDFKYAEFLIKDELRG
jgi:2-C-methyl-D-erythritol 4-phosphate cytidylyltransferase